MLFGCLIYFNYGGWCTPCPKCENTNGRQNRLCHLFLFSLFVFPEAKSENKTEGRQYDTSKLSSICISFAKKRKCNNAKKRKCEETTKLNLIHTFCILNVKRRNNDGMRKYDKLYVSYFRPLVVFSLSCPENSIKRKHEETTNFVVPSCFRFFAFWG
jgi:hypothetical protein